MHSSATVGQTSYLAAKLNLLAIVTTLLTGGQYEGGQSDGGRGLEVPSCMCLSSRNMALIAGEGLGPRGHSLHSLV